MVSFSSPSLAQREKEGEKAQAIALTQKRTIGQATLPAAQDISMATVHSGQRLDVRMAGLAYSFPLSPHTATITTLPSINDTTAAAAAGHSQVAATTKPLSSHRSLGTQSSYGRIFLLNSFSSFFFPSFLSFVPLLLFLFVYGGVLVLLVVVDSSTSLTPLSLFTID